MIDPNFFMLLPINDKAQMLWNMGKFIEAIEINEHDISLYSLNDQLIEIYFSIDKNRIEKICVLKDLERLKLYNIDQDVPVELV